MRGLTTLLPLVGAAYALPEAMPWAKRQLPEDPTGVHKIVTSNNVTIRYKEPGKQGICETTPGVKSYSGYVDIAPASPTFFYFFEARHDPANAPITLWLNGGPGSDSLIGLYEGLFSLEDGFDIRVLMILELGPCHINSKNESYINPHSWNEVSNMLFLSQPVGVGMMPQPVGIDRKDS